MTVRYLVHKTVTVYANLVHSRYNDTTIETDHRRKWQSSLATDQTIVVSISVC